MKMFVEPAHIYLHRDAVDFRKSIDGLVALVESELERDAYTGALFLFCNKAKDKLKLVYWDKTGFALWYKRLGATRSRFIYCWTQIQPFVLPKVSYFDMRH